MGQMHEIYINFMDAMKYSKEWEKKLLDIASKKYASRNENLQLSKLINAAGESDDERVAEALIKALQYKWLSGIAESIYGALSKFDYRTYYKIIFNSSSLLFSTNPEAAAQLLDWQMRDLTRDELEEILRMARSMLTPEEMGEYVEILKEYGYDHDEPYTHFIKYFKKSLREIGYE